MTFSHNLARISENKNWSYLAEISTRMCLYKESRVLRSGVRIGIRTGFSVAEVSAVRVILLLLISQ